MPTILEFEINFRKSQLQNDNFRHRNQNLLADQVNICKRINFSLNYISEKQIQAEETNKTGFSTTLPFKKHHEIVIKLEILHKTHAERI